MKKVLQLTGVLSLSAFLAMGQATKPKKPVVPATTTAATTAAAAAKPAVPAENQEVFSKIKQSFFNGEHLKTLEGQSISRRNVNQSELEGIWENKFISLGNNWFTTSDRKSYLLKKKNNNLYIYDDEGSLFSLNDSIIVLSDGRMLNLFEDNFVQSTLDKSGFLKVKTSKHKRNARILGSVNDPIVQTDILLSEPEDMTARQELIYNVLQDSTFEPKSRDTLRTVLNNAFSKYVLINDFLLMNRYDANDTVNLSRMNYMLTSSSVVSYNDSLFVISVPISESNMYLSFPYNTEIGAMYNDFMFRKDEQFYAKYPKNKEDAIPTLYFFNKYNKIEEKSINPQFFSRYAITYKNLINYDPFVLVVYNFKTNSIRAILDRSNTPFPKVDAVHFDKRSKLILVQSSDNYFTAFDADSFKEIVTLKGVINHIDAENNLVLNLIGKKMQNVPSSDVFPYKVNHLAMSLDELITSNNYFNPGFKESLNVDEFTRKDNFLEMLKNRRNTDMNDFVRGRSSSAKSIDVAVVANKYSNTDIKDKVEKDIRSYYTKQGIMTTDMKFPLEYVSYDLQNRTLEMKTSQLNYNDIAELGVFKVEKGHDAIEMNLFGAIKSYEAVSFSTDAINPELIAELKNKGAAAPESATSNEDMYTTVKITGVEYEEALKVKNADFKINVILRNLDEHSIPDYSYVFISKYFPVVRKFLYYQDAESLERFYQRYVPEVKSGYNSWFFDVNNKEALFRKMVTVAPAAPAEQQ